MSVLPQVAQGRQPAIAARVASLAEGPYLITAAVMLATFMEILDTTQFGLVQREATMGETLKSSCSMDWGRTCESIISR